MVFYTKSTFGKVIFVPICTFGKVFVYLQQISDTTIMDLQDIEQLNQVFYNKLADIETRYHRYLYEQINWDNRIIGIKGAAGVGKTTLILQHIKEHISDLSQVMYASLDNLWFQKYDLMELVDYHYAHNGLYLFLDEIHYLKNWPTYIKNIYDNYPKLRVVYTGSSILSITKHEVDLGRRQRVYMLQPMSFREFLVFEGYRPGNAYSIDQLLANHQSIAMRVVPQGEHILPLFERYCRYGCYPFYKEEGDGFSEHLQSTIRRVIENDLPQVEDISFSTIQKTMKLLLILSERVPLMPKMAELYRELDTTRDLGLRMLSWLEKACLINLASSEIKSLKSLSKPDKIYLNNPNLMYCLSSKVDKGTLRETFFYSQLSVSNEILLPKQGDFWVNKRYTFEVGGKGKTFEQIKDMPDSYIAIDDIEFGIHNRIPLWMFGLLY